jgi:hypothetical protein
MRPFQVGTSQRYPSIPLYMTVNEPLKGDEKDLILDIEEELVFRELRMHISVWHCGTAGVAIACAVVKAVASGARQRCHLSRSGQAVLNCWKCIIVEAEEGQRVINPVHCARKVTLLVSARVVDAHLLHFESLPGTGCELVGQREVDDCALVDLVVLVRQHAAFPEEARHIDLLTEVVHRLLEQLELIQVELLLLLACSLGSHAPARRVAVTVFIFNGQVFLF